MVKLLAQFLFYDSTTTAPARIMMKAIVSKLIDAAVPVKGTGGPIGKPVPLGIAEDDDEPFELPKPPTGAQILRAYAFVTIETTFSGEN